MPENSPRFIHLRTHSEHSLLEGAVPVKKLADLAAQNGMPAVALTDSNALFAALEFSVKAQDAGVQPIIGCQVALAGDVTGPVVLLAQNEAGWLNLMALSTCLYLRDDHALPHVTVEELESHAEGLICLTGGAGGPLGQLVLQGRQAEARALTERLAAAFPTRLYVELQRHHDAEGQPVPEEAGSEGGMIDIAYALDLPLVATNDVYFPKPELFDAHDALICISERAYVDQTAPRRRLTPQHYFKTAAEMATLFADLPEAVQNTVEIARRCAFAVKKHKPILPRFADDEVEELRRQAWDGLRARLAVIPHSAPVEEYEERLRFELGIIEQMGFPGYFLIVADFIKWAKEHGIPVGPGRGSGAGSLVAYALTITDLDPIRYSLLFERFLNPERVSMPDFDIDFCMDRREEVIQYVQEKYGRDKVGQIITFGALLSKAAVRDVGRVLQLPFGQVDRLSKMIPVEGVKPVSVTKALADEPRLREAAREEVVGRLLDYAAKIEGLLRNASTHAAGVVIGDRPLHRLVPLYRDPASDMPATQFNMKWVEQAGLVKFDFLGLKTLTVIQNAVDLINAGGRPLHVAADGRVLYEPAKGAENQINAIPLDDKPSYDLFASARTVAVFQVESSGMMDALRRMKPTCIEDIVALVALYRPGPMENIPTYCEVKNGLRPLESIHPSIDHILAETQGIIVYQEQVMQIAQVMAGYSLGGADLLRRAMGKKIAEEMAKERPKFVEGCKQQGIDAKKAGEVFDLLEKFANYGFNKSHAAAYAVVSYQTAWLKANHPVEFMAAVMNCDIHLTDKLAVYKREADRMGIETMPPCVNRSEATFSVKDGKILYALGALKGVGVEAMNLIVQARGERPFADLHDFARRVDMRRVGKRPLEMLARAGAFDALEPNRARVLKSLDGLVAWSAAVQAAAASSQSSLFGGGEDLPPPRPVAAPVWMPAEKLAEEHAAVGFYLSGHPLDDYQPALRRKGVQTLAEVTQAAADGALVAQLAGTVAHRQEKKSARGTRFAFVGLSDPSGLYEVTVFSDTLDAHRQHLEPGENVVLQVQVEPSGDQVKLLARSVMPLEQAVADAGANRLAVEIAGLDAVPAVAEALSRILAELNAPARARGPIALRLKDGADLVDIEIAEDAPLTTPARQALRVIPGVLEVLEE
ncbi:DNA polymerase III subunit alpha [Paracoccus sp. P2]|uniref:DNA polymerase III subunit alpha n=1 Tax=Paracoccus pantotrophus TaxID=82367 RepID=A0A7H9BVZ3_PARPN|nr:DNA polymerase III subunit alpha [Paracoccus pantotrophus]QLH14988.1 DNA polymerase III subunit alpha [Paracoccus pantotrophus]RDD96508.1 DNA polymerase III subunit alpha [Paracoccus pantotrophus]RNI15542.1 DNA polymerase III subunit alpha [Paracoccus pantotrophus]WGR65369.1 DNA polymerase III subunit alpha [Paracoccus pantotrophus]